ncbi:GRIK3 [Branchiostoma lanceolatum]|uniref:GRIK3 protein n=1 Tax=Branchiostoma lanceolatum TaxID=7740 RepID=A0A8K0EPG5_BRALA|nr:GRIK3 [Branchiostoma lanceolatum]
MLLWFVILLLASSGHGTVFKIGVIYSPALSSYKELIDGAIEDVNSRGDILPDHQLTADHVLLPSADLTELILKKQELDDTNVTAIIVLDGHREPVHLEASSTPGVPRMYVSPGVLTTLPTGVSLYPGDAMLATLLADVVEGYGWKSMVVVYDDIHGLDTLGPFVNAAAFAGNRVVYMKVKTNRGLSIIRPQLREVLGRVRETVEPTIILHCDTFVTRDVLDEARNFVLLRKETHWIITNLRNASVLQALAVDAVTTVALALDESVRQGYDLQSQDWSRNGTLLDHIKQVSFEGQTGWVSFNQGGSRRNVSVDVIENDSGNLTKAGTWSEVNRTLGLTKSGKDGPFVFGNKPFRVVTRLSPPWVTKKIDSESFHGIDKYEGFLVDLMKVLSKRLNFTIDVEKVYDGELYDKEIKRQFDKGVHLGMVMKSMREMRRKYYELSPELVEFGYTIFTPKPVKELTGLLSFMTPLSPQMWIFFALAMVVVSLFLTLVNQVNPYEWRWLAKRGQVEPSQGGYYNAWNSLWNVFSSTVGQGAENPPMSFGGRIILGSWWFFVLVVMASYTANLAAFLTVKPVNPIRSMEDLARQNKLEYGFIKTYAIRRLFETADSFPLRDMWERIRANPDWLVDSNEEGIKRAAKGNYAFITFSGVKFRRISELCEVEMVGQPFYKYHVAFPIPIGSPHKIKISLEIEKMRLVGVIEELSRKWLEVDRGRCKESKRETDEGVLGMENLLGLFVILGAISALGMAVCVIEVIVFKLKEMDRESMEEKQEGKNIEEDVNEDDVVEESEDGVLRDLDREDGVFEESEDGVFEEESQGDVFENESVQVDTGVIEEVELHVIKDSA